MFSFHHYQQIKVQVQTDTPVTCYHSNIQQQWLSKQCYYTDVKSRVSG